jgi:hypothetical protein
MSNYQSVARKYNKPTSSINLAYIDQTLKEKQGTIDENYGILSQSVDMVLGQDLARLEDRELLRSKISEAMNNLSNSDSINFSSKKSRFAIQDSLSSAAKDPEILKHLAITKNIRQIGAFQADRSAKGTLNPQNFRDAYKEAGIEDYMAGKDKDGNKVDTIGNFNYLEYRNVDEKLRKAAKDYQSMKPDQKVKYLDGDGNLMEKPKSLLTKSEWYGKIYGVLDASDIAQYGINGAAAYNFDDQIAKTDINNKIIASTKDNIDKIAILEGKVKNTTSESEIEGYNKEIEALNAINEKVALKYSSYGTTAKEIGGTFLQEAALNNMASFLAMDGEESIVKTASELYKTNTTAKAKNLTGADWSTLGLGSSPIPENLKEKYGSTLDPTKQYFERTAEFRKSRNTFVEGKLEELKKLDIKAYNAIKLEIEREGVKTKDPERAAAEVLLNYSTKNSPALKSFMSLDDKKRQFRDNLETEAYEKGIIDSADLAVQTAFTDTEEAWEQLNGFENQNIRLHGVDANKDVIKYLNENGVTDEATYKKFINSGSKKSNLFKASMLAQTLKIEQQKPGDISFGSEDIEFFSKELKYYGVETGLNADIVKLDGGVRASLTKIEGLTEEPISVFYKGNKVLMSDVPNNESVQLLSEKGSFLRKSIQGSYNTTGFYDSHASRDGDLISIFGSEKIGDRFTSNFNIAAARISGRNAIVVTGDDMINSVNEIMPEALNIKDKNAKLNIIKNEQGLYQIYEQTVKTEKTVTGSNIDTPSIRTVGQPISKERLQNTDLGRFIDFTEEERDISFALDKQFKVKNIGYREDDSTSNTKLLTYLTNNNLQSQMVYANKVQFLKGMGVEHGEGTESYNFAKKVTENMDKFEISYDAYEDGQNSLAKMTIGMKGVKKPIGEISTSDRRLITKYMELSSTMPEVFISRLIEDLLNTKKNQGFIPEGMETIESELKKYNATPINQ